MCNLLDIDRNKSQIIKGIAILVMIFHHFFGMYAVPMTDVLKEHLSNDVLFSTCHSLAGLGKVCVLLFAFVTGYGYFVIIKKETASTPVATRKRLCSFLPFCMFIVLIVYLLMLLFPTWLNLSIGNALLSCIGASYIPDNWYMIVVLVTAAFYFPLLLLAYRKGENVHAFVFILLNIVNYYLFPIYSRYNEISFLKLFSVLELTYTIPYFMLGYACRYAIDERSNAKYRILLVAVAILGAYLHSWRPLHLLLLAATILATHLISIMPSKVVSCFVILGKFSACMWLTHRLVFGYWFTTSIYEIPCPLNYIVVVVISLLLSIVITKSWQFVNNYTKTRLNRHKKPSTSHV